MKEIVTEKVEEKKIEETTESGITNYMLMAGDELLERMPENIKVLFSDFYVIDVSDFSKYAKIIEAVPSPYDGMLIVKKYEHIFSAEDLKKYVPKVNYRDGNENIKNRSGLEKIAKEAFKGMTKVKNINISCPHCVLVDVPKEVEGDLNVIFWSGDKAQCVKNDYVKAPEKLWGIPVSTRDSKIEPARTGYIIEDPAERYIAAEAHGTSLFIYFDACHSGDTNEENVFKKIVEEFRDYLISTPEQLEEKKLRDAAEAFEKNKSLYAEACAVRTRKNIEASTKDLEDSLVTVKEYNKLLVDIIRKINGLENKIYQLKDIEGKDSNKYKLEYTKLMENPKITEVRVYAGVVEIYTKMLYCENPKTNKLHEIGKFMIRVTMDGSNNGVRWFNQTRRLQAFKEKQMAPHIWSTGEACLGNFSEVLPELIANYEFAALGMMAIAFVESCNMDDPAGKHIVDWPVVDPVTLKIIAPHGRG